MGIVLWDLFSYLSVPNKSSRVHMYVHSMQIWWKVIASLHACIHIAIRD